MIALALLALACGIVGVMPSFEEAALEAAVRAAAVDHGTAVPAVPESGRPPPTGAERTAAATPVSDDGTDSTDS